MAGPKFINGDAVFIDWDSKWINRVETETGVIYKFKFRPRPQLRLRPKAPIFRFEK